MATQRDIKERQPEDLPELLFGVACAVYASSCFMNLVSVYACGYAGILLARFAPVLEVSWKIDGLQRKSF